MKQEQGGGEGSTNNQAGRDVVVHNHYYGMADEHVRELALQQEKTAVELWEKNAPRLVQKAGDEFAARAIEITREVIQQVIAENPEHLERFGEARSQVPLLKAQQSYGETGNRAFIPHLASLVAQLIGSEPQSYTEMVARRCIDCLTNMTSRHLNLIAVVTNLQRRHFPYAITVEQLATGLTSVFGPYIGNIPTQGIEYSYIHSLGVADDGNMGLLAAAFTGTKGDINPYERLRSANPNAMYDGFRIADLPELAQTLDGNIEIFVYTADDPDLRYLHPDFGNKWLNQKEKPEDAAEAELIAFCKSRMITAEELGKRIRAIDPPLAELLDTLDQFNALAMNLNPVGLMLAAQEETVRANGEKSTLFEYFDVSPGVATFAPVEESD